jgi:hypothetical protein
LLQDATISCSVDKVAAAGQHQLYLMLFHFRNSGICSQSANRPTYQVETRSRSISNSMRTSRYNLHRSVFNVDRRSRIVATALQCPTSRGNAPARRSMQLCACGNRGHIRSLITTAALGSAFADFPVTTIFLQSRHTSFSKS